MDFERIADSIKNTFKDLFNLDERQKRKIKIALATGGGIVAALYFAFLIVPHFINLNNYIPMISDEVEKMSGLKLSADNPKISTTFRLGVKVNADDVSINYKDNTPLLSLKKPEIEINLPTILIGHINLDKIKADEINAYLVFTKDKKYTLEEYVNTILENTLPKEEEADKADSENGFSFPIETNNVNIKVTKAALHLKDENVNKTYLAELNNSNILLKSLDGPLSVKTNGFIGIEDSDVKFANLDIDLKTKLPKAIEEDAQKADKDETAELPEFNFNPLKTLEDFNLRTDIFAKLNIKNIEDFKAQGDLNVQKFSLKIGDVQLPDSYVNLNFKDRDINVDSKVFAAKDEFIQTKSTVTTGKKGKLNLNVKTDKITLKSLKDIIGAVLQICLVENDMKNMSANGYIKGDFNLETDYKTIKSNGVFKLIDGNITYSKAGLVLSQMKAFLDFSENALNIKDTSALVNGAKFSIDGEIASNSDVNLTVKSDPLKIKDLVNAATEFKLVNKKDIADFDFKDGALTLSVNVLGDIKNIQPKADIDLNSFKMLVKSAKMPINIDNINIVARPNKNKKGEDDIDAVINVKNISASLSEPSLKFSAPGAKITADMANIIIEPVNATLEGTKINLAGDVKNYMQNPELNLKISGNVHPNTVLAFIPKEFKKDVRYLGQMPYSALVSGTLENLKISGNLTTNSSNYVSVVEIPSYKGFENVLNFETALKGDVFDLSDVSVKSSNGGKIASVKGQVKNIYAKEPVLSGININLPNKTNIVIPMLGNMSLNASGDLALSGKAFSPDMTGNIDVDTVKYPDFGFTLDSLNLNFNKSSITAKADGAKVANSDFRGDANISTNFSKGIVINSLNYASDYIDTDALIALADKIMKTMPAPAPSASNAPKGGASADLGVDIKGGNAKIGKLKSGTLMIENIAYDHTLLKNVYNLNNLKAIFAQGVASGTCSYNVMTGKISVDMKAENIAMRDAAKAFIGVDLVRSGTLEGAAKVTLSGATLQEQLKTLSGTVTFEVKNGEYGENISFGRFINAANVLNLGTFSSVLNSVTSKVNSFNTREFENVSGILTFNNGTAKVSNFKSGGPNMSLYATGTYNLLNNHANLKVTGKVSSKVAGVLGTLGADKLQTSVEKVTAAAENAINKAADKLTEKYGDNKAVQTGLAVLGALKNAQSGGAGTNTASTTTEQKTPGQTVTTIIKEKVNPLFGAIPAGDIANVPALSAADAGAGKNFQVTINGLITSPASIRSIKFQNTAPTTAQ